MPENDLAPQGALPGQQEHLRQTLDRIAAALEMRNAQDQQASKKEGEGDAGDKKGKDGAEAKDGEAKGGESEGGQDNKKGEGDDKKTEGGEKKGKAKRFFLSPLGIILTLVVLAVLIIAGLAIWHYGATHVSTNDAYTAGHVHQVSPRVTGLVLERWVDDNQEVAAGDLLVKLDPRDYEVSFQKAQAGLDQAKANVLSAQANIAQAKAAGEQAQAQVAQARAQTSQAGAQYEVAGINYGRNSALFTKDARAVAQADVDSTKGSFDSAKAAFEGAKSNTQATEANAAAAKAQLESREADLVVNRAQVENAQAAYDDARLQLSYCWVVAPVSGRISKRSVEIGQQLSVGQAIMSVTPDEVWVLANFKETQIEKIRVGQQVTIPVDAFPKHPFTGRIDSIQNGSGATYSLLPPDNATGNFTKIVQRVPVKIVFDHDDRDTSIKGFEKLVVPGLSCVPVVDLASASDRGDHVAKDQPAPRKRKDQR